MFENGIGPEELAWIEREQFLRLEMERRLSHPVDWEAFRLALVGALSAAWGLNTRYPAGQIRHELLSVPQRRALHPLDELRVHHDPVTDWLAFRESLWTGGAGQTERTSTAPLRDQLRR
ncbi:MAG: hypothetical protein R3343_12135 [Nitriliruptorales bacterium]|nr:hypothetical protein [Nitriliruptorales bacterium]